MENMGTAITYDKVIADAKQLKELSTDMSNIFDDFGSSMNKVGAEDVYAGSASETLGERFNKLKGKFDSYVRLVNEFASMLESASEQTAATERELNKEAEELQS